MTEKTAKKSHKEGEKQEEKWNGSAKLPHKKGLKAAATEHRAVGYISLKKGRIKKIYQVLNTSHVPKNHFQWHDTVTRFTAIPP